MKKLQTILALMLVALTANAQLCPDNHHPHMIDLGLPSGTKWACCNVDTEHPEKQCPTNYGGYYAWGETEVKDVYNDVSYQYSTGDDKDGDGYYDDWLDTNSNVVWQDLGSDIAGTKYDVAHVKWGGPWVMPSDEQIEELLDNCTYEWTTVNGVEGGKFKSLNNGGTIFLPAAGHRFGGGLRYVGSHGEYWLPMPNPSSSFHAYCFAFSSLDAGCYTIGIRDFGRTVRPVSR